MARKRIYTNSRDGILRTEVTVTTRLTARQIELLEIIANGEGTVNTALEHTLSDWADNLEDYCKDFGYIK